MSKSIAERIEALEGPCREVDAEVAQRIGYVLRLPEGDELPCRLANVRRWFDPDGYSIGWYEGLSEFPPHYTASLDAAMTLVPEGWLPIIDCTYIRPEVELHPTDEGSFGLGRRFGKAATPALALCAAALRAQEATNG